MESHTWSVQVGYLIKIFHSSLLDLIPHLEAAHIPWREGEAYDDWDNITTVLFESIVLGSIRWGIADGTRDTPLPAYGHIHDDYSERSLIEVLVEKPTASPKWIFLRFSSEESALDSVKCLALGEDGEVLTAESRTIPLANASYRLWIREHGRLEGPITHLSVEL